MSNGHSTCGGANAEFKHSSDTQEHKGRISVTQSWSSSANWVELTATAYDDPKDQRFAVYLDSDSTDAAEFAAAVLRGVGEEEMADALLAKNKAYIEQQAVRERALEAGYAAQKAATAKFLDATADARAEFDATMDTVEGDFMATTGQEMTYSRSVSWGQAKW